MYMQLAELYSLAAWNSIGTRSLVAALSGSHEKDAFLTCLCRGSEPINLFDWFYNFTLAHAKSGHNYAAMGTVTPAELSGRYASGETERWINDHAVLEQSQPNDAVLEQSQPDNKKGMVPGAAGSLA